MENTLDTIESTKITAENISGTWMFIQKWNGHRAYSFNAEFNANGTISINNGTFLGTYKSLGNSNQIALAIASFIGPHQSITSYVGNFLGNAMGGQAAGTSIGQKNSIDGIWSAHKMMDTDDKIGFHIPS